MLAAGALATLGALPVFLLGAQSVLVREELKFGEPELGLAVGAFFAAAAVATLATGPLADTWSRGRNMVVAGLLAGASTSAIAVAATSYQILLALLVLAGVANAALQTTANAALAQSVPRNRQGLAFGVKQSAVPASILLGGLAVPAIGLLVGWRWTYAAAAVAAMAVVAAGARTKSDPANGTPRSEGRISPPAQPLVITGAAAALANASASSLGAFLPAWAFQTGLSPGTAGLLVAAGAGLCVVGRVLSGIGGDRRNGRNFPVVVVQLVAGAAGLALLSLSATETLVIGAVLAFGLGWSSPGLLMFAVVRVGRDRAATASSAVQAGGFVGGALGPILFGVLVAIASYPTAWLTAATVMLIAAVLLMFARRLFLADLVRRPLLDR
jgi:MFS family permease